MHTALPQLLYLWDLEEQRGRGGLIHRMEGSRRGEATKSKVAGTFYGVVDPSGIIS